MALSTSRIHSTVDRVFRSVGGVAPAGVLTRKTQTGGAVDAEGNWAPPTPETYDCRVLVLAGPLSPQEGQTWRPGDRRGFVTDAEPRPGDILTVNGIDYDVVSVQDQSANSGALYEAVLRHE